MKAFYGDFKDEILKFCFGWQAVDHLVETKGLDAVDRIKAKKDATRAAENMVAEKYGMQAGADDTPRPAAGQRPSGNSRQPNGNNNLSNQGFNPVIEAGDY